MSFISVMLLLVVFYSSRVAQAVRTQDNPFTDVLITAPTYHPPKTGTPWNVYEVPEMPEKFIVDFVYNGKIPGRYVTDAS